MVGSCSKPPCVKLGFVTRFLTNPVDGPLLLFSPRPLPSLSEDRRFVPTVITFFSFLPPYSSFSDPGVVSRLLCTARPVPSGSRFQPRSSREPDPSSPADSMRTTRPWHRCRSRRTRVVHVPTTTVPSGRLMSGVPSKRTSLQ